MELRDYLRSEILEEAELGYLSSEERDRKLSLFDSVTGPSAQLTPLKASVDAEPANNEAEVAEDDLSIVAGKGVSVDADASVQLYYAKPRDAGVHPGVVVVHENKGLVPYVEDVTRRLAKRGYFAVAPDLLSRRGGTSAFADPSAVTAALATIPNNELLEDMMSAVSYLIANPEVGDEKIGALGFCFGGGMTWILIENDARIKAAVAFYGPNPPLEDVPKIAAKVLAIYGERDERINSGISEIEAAMHKEGKVFEKKIFPEAQHAFHNNTNPDRYSEEAANAAWGLAITWFKRWL